MKQLEPTTTMQMDDKTFEISKMSPEIQQLVQYYDDWRQREVEVSSELAMVRMAQQTLQSQLVQRVQAEIAEAPAAAPASDVQDVQVKPTRKTKGK